MPASKKNRVGGCAKSNEPISHSFILFDILIHLCLLGVEIQYFIQNSLTTKWMCLKMQSVCFLKYKKHVFFSEHIQNMSTRKRNRNGEIIEESAHHAVSNSDISYLEKNDVYLISSYTLTPSVYILFSPACVFVFISISKKSNVILRSFSSPSTVRRQVVYGLPIGCFP